MTIIEFAENAVPLRYPDERDVHDTTPVVMSMTPSDDKILSSSSGYSQFVPKALVACILSSFAIAGALCVVTVALPGSDRGITSFEDRSTSSASNNVSPGSVLRFTASTEARIGPPSWRQLSSQLSEGAFKVSKADDWLDQCVHPFADIDLSDRSKWLSSYQLFEQPSGMCMIHVNCAYKGCRGPFLGYSSYSYNSSEYSDDMLTSANNGLDLPDATVHPIHVGDLSKAIEFAAANNIEVSVKTTGHSYTGASTKQGTILLNLSKLQKYSPGGSIVECDTDDILDGASQESCNLALARGKTAFVRVGGGEIWDEALRAVSFDWNNNPDNSRKYHLLSGAAGTVSAAGGWLASGGLSGNGDMRSFGVGVDQVLHVEMVLPSGLHVRFGPTDWETNNDMMYPRTIAITGYCNNGDLSDEDSWDWQECGKRRINFHDLWFAVRGGGGGSYGVITSIYYQLHKYTVMQVTVPVISVAVENMIQNQGSSDEDVDDFKKAWYDFVLRFFFDPKSIDVTESASNSCSSPADGGFGGGRFICYDGAGDVMKEAWKRFHGDSDGTIDTYFTVENVDSWAEWNLKGGDYEFVNGVGYSGVPEGRLRDEGPSPTLTNTMLGNIQLMMVPEDVLITKRDEIVGMVFNCLSRQTCSPLMYIMGGKIPAADDGVNSLPPHRRHGGFLMGILDPTLRTEFTRLFNNISDGEVWTGDSFPGTLCHNHASLEFPTPLKEDWALTCDPFWTKEQKEEKCMSYQEAAWGTDILGKLDRIHTDVDPDHLFNPDDGPGYAARSGKNRSSKSSKKRAKQGKSKSTKDYKYTHKVGDEKSGKKSKKVKKSWEYE